MPKIIAFRDIKAMETVLDWGTLTADSIRINLFYNNWVEIEIVEPKQVTMKIRSKRIFTIEKNIHKV
jgi:hypothetical protein